MPLFLHLRHGLGRDCRKIYDDKILPWHYAGGGGKMFRTAVFCFYEKNRTVGDYVIYLLESLKEVIGFLIIVVNGELKEIDKLEKHSDILIVRENKGYDICAYKEALTNRECKEIIKHSEELVFANSSFYGPFVPLASIFRYMENSKADFWGMSSVEKNLVRHIQSYFYVFRKKVIDEGRLFQYIDRHINLEGMGYFEVCAAFENGLFSYLLESGYQYDAFSRDINCEPYKNPYGSIVIDRVPVLKRKIFSNAFFQREQACSALAAIKAGYEYDVRLILEDVGRTYGIDLPELSLYSGGKPQKDLFQRKGLVDREDILGFIRKYGEVYVYGTGGLADNIFSCFFFYPQNPQLKGFVVSDGQRCESAVHRSYPVYFLSAIRDRGDAAILVAMNEENSMEVSAGLSCCKNVMYIWEKLNRRAEHLHLAEAEQKEMG